MSTPAKFRVTVDLDVSATSFGKAQEYVQSVIGLGWDAVLSNRAKDQNAMETDPNIEYFNTKKIKRL